MSWLRVSARNSRRKSSPASKTPASPWIGSSITATVRSSMARATAARSPSGTLRNPGTFGSNSVPQPGLPEADIVASVRPWKACSMVMISKAPFRWRAPHLRASLMAPSFASALLLQRNTWSSPEASARRVASFAMGSL